MTFLQRGIVVFWSADIAVKIYPVENQGFSKILRVLQKKHSVAFMFWLSYWKTITFFPLILEGELLNIVMSVVLGVGIHA
ncbi:hypothetical protein [Emcibacter nanhaiensis]|uniref:Uncharacterized protein n=1 Tax=Emcibacter nanhaiensis TaxID=1505037 RepID=A0A501PH22_9PROT|nr:hypothetical protein [Emcibacter nanhaiensis]TPD59378.1 hypothetical protein FIV46_11330 [Emcibacter nanhaiensis]